MKRIASVLIIVVCILAAPGVYVGAQEYRPAETPAATEPAVFTFDMKPLWSKIDLDYRDQVKLSASRSLMEFDLGVTTAPFRFKYCLTTGMRPGSDRIVPADIVRVNGVEFGEKQKGVGQAFQPAGSGNQKPLQIDWSMGHPTGLVDEIHRLICAAGRDRRNVRCPVQCHGNKNGHNPRGAKTG